MGNGCTIGAGVVVAKNIIVKDKEVLYTLAESGPGGIHSNLGEWTLPHGNRLGAEGLGAVMVWGYPNCYICLVYHLIPCSFISYTIIMCLHRYIVFAFTYISWLSVIRILNKYHAT